MRILAYLSVVAAQIASHPVLALDPAKAPPIRPGVSSTGDVSSMSVTPSASAAPGSIASMLAGASSLSGLSVAGQIVAHMPGASSIVEKFPGSFRFIGNNNNAIVGAVLSNRPARTTAFDTAVTGYGQLAAGSNGNTVFGLFGRADLYAPGIGTNEVNSFNFTGQDAPTSYPWDRSFGTAQSIGIALTVAAGGGNKSAAGIELGREGSIPNYFQYGMVMRKDSNAIWNIYLDADSESSAQNGIYSAIVGNGTNLLLKTTGKQISKKPALAIVQADGAVNASINQDGSIYGTSLNLRQITVTSSSAPCKIGDMTVDDSYIYVCIANNRWRRVALVNF